MFGKEAEERAALFGAELELSEVGLAPDGGKRETVEDDYAKKRAPEELKRKLDRLAPADALEEDEA